MVSRELPAGLVEQVERHSINGGALVADAYVAGRRAEAERMAVELDDYIGELLAELERSFEEGPVADVEECYRDAEPSPVVAAHYGSAAAVLHGLRDQVRRIATPEANGANEESSG